MSAHGAEKVGLCPRGGQSRERPRGEERRGSARRVERAHGAGSANLGRECPRGRESLERARGAERAWRAPTGQRKVRMVPTGRRKSGEHPRGGKRQEGARRAVKVQRVPAGQRVARDYARGAERGQRMPVGQERLVSIGGVRRAR